MSGNSQNDTTDRNKSANVAALFTGLDREQLVRISTTLDREYQIDIQRDRSSSSVYSVQLFATQLFERLVTLYTNLFKTHWSTLKHIANMLSPRSDAEKQNIVASTYISAWFWDLYVSNREATRSLPSNIFNDFYSHEINYIAGRYDPFLQHLNTIIRPTHVKDALVDAMYYPYICKTPNFTPGDYNPFGIPKCQIEVPILQSLLETFDDSRNEFSTLPCNTNTLGRPGWLFDYSGYDAYAWFPMNNNFSLIDAIAPFILGIPCTPRLGPRDIDDWTDFKRNQVVSNAQLYRYPRTAPRRFYGSAEFRSIDKREYVLNFDKILNPPKEKEKDKSAPSPSAAPSSSAPRTDPQALPAPETAPSVTAALVTTTPVDQDATMKVYAPPTVKIHQYRFTDWCYHYQIIRDNDEQVINKAFRTFLFKGAKSSSD